MLVMCKNTAVSSQLPGVQDMLEVYAGTMEHWPEDQLRFSGSLCFTLCVLLVGLVWVLFCLSFTSYERDL